MVRGIFLPAEDDAPLEEREIIRLEDYQAAVGGLFQPVDVPTLGITIYVNEEGRLHRLHFNRRVTVLWCQHVEPRRSTSLFGNAVIVGPLDRSGRPTDIPNAVRVLLQDHFGRA